jgi:hypothetical protein
MRSRYATLASEAIGIFSEIGRTAASGKRAAEIAADCETGAIQFKTDTDRKSAIEIFGRCEVAAIENLNSIIGVAMEKIRENRRASVVR